MSLINRLLTPAKIREAAEQVFAGLMSAAPGVGRALELPIASASPSEDMENSMIVAYLMKEKGDHIVVSKTHESLILQLRQDFDRHTPEGKGMLINSGRTVQTSDAREILATAKKLKE